MALDWPDDCRCPPIQAGHTVFWNSRVWDDLCPLHGVGTESFQRRAQMPFGYAEERRTTREEWLKFRSTPVEPDGEDWG